MHFNLIIHENANFDRTPVGWSRQNCKSVYTEKNNVWFILFVLNFTVVCVWCGVMYRIEVDRKEEKSWTNT